MGDLFEGFREVGDHHRCGIHDAVAIDFGGAFFFFCDPDGFNAEDGFACGDAFEVDHAARDIHGEPAVGDHRGAGKGFAPEEEVVFVRLEFQTVADGDRRNDHAVVAGKAFANAGDAVEEVAALGFIGKAEESIAHFDGEDFCFDELVEIFRAGICRGSLAACGALLASLVGVSSTRCGKCEGAAFGSGREWVLGLLFEHIRREACYAGEYEEGCGRHAGSESESGYEAGSDAHGARVGSELFADLGSEAVVALGASHEQTCGNGDDQCRNLGNKAVTDGKECVFLEGLVDRHALLEHADAESADDVDEGDEDAGHGIASHEFAGTVHRAVEVGFFLDFESAGCGGEFVDDAGVEFGVDGHLFTWHRIQGESCGDLGNTARALGDDDEIDDDENDENDRADDVVTLDEHMAEGFDDISGEAVEQDESRGGDVQRQSQQGDGKENGGEGGELRRILHIDDHEQDQQRDADVYGQ